MDDQDYIQYCQKQYERTLSGLADENQLFRNGARAISLSVFGLNYGSWLNECLAGQNWAGLNDLVFQAMRWSLVPGLPSATDHCILWLPTLAAFACGEDDVTERTLPRELGLPRNGHPFDVLMSSLLVSVWYREEKWLATALTAAERFCAQKRPKWQKAAVWALIALQNEDIPATQAALQRLCEGFPHSDFSSEEKQLCIPAHGLYCFALQILPREKSAMLAMPEHRNFSKEYAAWRRENPSPAHRLYFEYPSPMELFNQLLLAPVAKSMLKRPYLHSDSQYLSAKDKTAWFLDEEAMLTSFCHDLCPPPLLRHSRQQDTFLFPVTGSGVWLSETVKQCVCLEFCAADKTALHCKTARAKARLLLRGRFFCGEKARSQEKCAGAAGPLSLPPRWLWFRYR